MQPNLVASAVAPPPPPGGGGTISFDVFGYVMGQGTTIPITSASVKIYVEGVYKGVTFTNSYGYFSTVVIASSLSENFEVVVIKSDWNDKTKYAVADWNDNVNFGNVYMTKTYEISGTVKWGSTVPVPSACVTLYRDIGAVWSEIGQTTSSAYGDFYFQYTTGSPMTECKAVAVADGFGNPGTTIVSVSSTTVAIGIVSVSHSYYPDLRATVDPSEKEAVLEWVVNDWGNMGPGTNCYALIKYKGVNALDWEVTPDQIPIAFGVTEGTYLLTGLVMATEYSWSIVVGHTILDEERVSQTIEGTFTTNTWTCTSKYAIVIDLTFLTADTEYDEHLASRNEILEFLNLGNGQNWYFDDIHSTSMDPNSNDWDGDPAEELAGHISHFKGVTNEHSLLFIYIVGHGDSDIVKVGARVSSGGTDVGVGVIADALELYDDNDHTPGKIVMVIETCLSGSLIDDLSADDRVVITAANWYRNAVVVDGYGLFTYYFAYNLKLGSQYSLYDNYGYAYTQVKALYDGPNVPHDPFQYPTLNDLSSGVGEIFPDIKQDAVTLGKRVNQCGALACVLTLWIVNQ